PARTYALETMTRSLKSVGSADLWRGDSIYFSGAEELDQHVWALPFSQATMRAAGPPQRLSDGREQEQQIAIGPDGRLPFAALRLSSDLWSIPIDANQGRALGKMEQVTSDGVRAQLPSIAQNGSKMVYVSNRSGVRDLWVAGANGKGAEALTSFHQV